MAGVGPPTGGRIGARIAELAATATSRARAATADAEAALRQRATVGIMEQLEREGAILSSNWLAAAVDDPELDETTRQAIRDLTTPRHPIQLVALVGVLISAGLVIGQAAAAGMTDRLQRWSMNQFADVSLTPDQMAELVTRNWMSHAEGAASARQFGLRGDWWNGMVELAGTPLNIEMLVAAWQRGIITEARLDKGIRQGRTKDEWIDVVKALRWGPMPAGNAIAAAVEGHLTQDQARELVALNGIDPKWFGPMFETAGRPPGVEQMGELANRGLVSEAEWEMAVRESDVKNKYIPALREARTRIPPMEQTTTMMRRGALTAAEGLKILMQHGFSAEHAQSMVDWATTEKAEETRALAKAEVMQLYDEALIARAVAAGFLVELGYDPDDVEMLLALRDTAKERRRVGAAVNRVKGLFVAYRIDQPEAAGALDRLGVAPGSRDDLLAVWTIERETATRDLTLAQVQSAAKKGLIDETELARRLQGLGYSDDDVVVLMALTLGGTQPPGGA